MQAGEKIIIGLIHCLRVSLDSGAITMHKDCNEQKGSVPTRTFCLL